MTVRLPHACVGALCLGFALANLARPGVLLGLAAASVLGCVGFAASDSRLRSTTLAAAVVAVAWGWGSLRLAQLDHSVLATRIATAEWAVVEVEEPPRPGTFDQRMKVRVLRWGTLRADEQALLELPLGRSPPRGARLKLLGELRAPPGPSNGFDEAKWLRRQGIHVVLRAQSYRVVGRRGGVSGVGDRVGRWLAGDTTAGLTGVRRDVIEAIVLGRSSGMDKTLLADFRATGLYHCLAVDGLKVAAVGGATVAVVLLLGLGIYVAQLAALATVATYALAVGLHPSVVRAALAAGLGSLAWLAGRERDRWQALLVGAAVLLGWNPYALFDAGFQLSFAAVASIFVVTPRVVRALEGYPVSHELAQLIGVSTACGLATAPVTWFQFHQVSLVTVPANVVAVPVVVEVLGLALLTAVVAPVAPSVAGRWPSSTAGVPRSWPCVRVHSRASPVRRSRPRARPPSSVWGRSLPPPMLGNVASERELKPVYLLTGTDRPKIAVALRRLRERIGEDATERLDAGEATAEDAVAACNALGLFGGEARLVVVDGVETWKTADVKELETYLAAPAPTTVLALVGSGIKRDSALAKGVARVGQVLAYDVSKKQLPDWAAEQFTRLGASADRDACRALVETVGDDVGDLASEIQKLTTWANGEPITRATVEELAVGQAETAIFAVTDAWGRRDVAATLRATESLLDRSHRPRSGELIRLVASLVGHIGRVRKASRLADEGVRSSEIASRLKIHPFVAEKSAKQARNFSPDELSQATVRLAELDAGAKGGSRLPAELQLERTLVAMTRPAE